MGDGVTARTAAPEGTKRCGLGGSVENFYSVRHKSPCADNKSLIHMDKFFWHNACLS